MKALDLAVRPLWTAARSLARRPMLSVVAVLTLALGIGANAAIFSIVNVVLLEPLPFQDPDRLVTIWTTVPSQGLDEGFSSYPDFRDWKEQSRSFDDMATVWTFPNGDVNLTGGAEPQRVSVARISTGFFGVLGVEPLHGRTFTADESIVGNHRRAILSHGLWLRDFGGDSTLVGRSVMVNGFPYEVVGIMPAELETRSVKLLGTDVQLWRPLAPDDGQTGGRGSRKLRVVGRLAAGVTVQQATAELASTAMRLAEVYPETNRDTGVRLVPLREHVVRDVRRALIFLLAAVAAVLLGACANVANLLLIRAAAARKERAVRHALGASRGRLMGEVLAESVVLGVVAAALGILLAFGIVRAVVATGPADIPLLADTRIDGTVLAFSVAATLLTVVLVGLAPAARSGRPPVGELLRQSGRSRARDDRRLMGALTVVQIALAMVLLTAGGLMLRSFRALLRVDSGLETERSLTFQLELPMGSGMPYSSQPPRDAFFATLLERVEGLPGVRAAALTSAPPLEEEPSEFVFSRPDVSDDVFRANYRLITPNYFSLLGIPIRSGRPFSTTDGRSDPPVAIVSGALARSVWGSTSPLGSRIRVPFGGESDYQIVGVAGDVRTTGLDGDASPMVYVPAAQGGFNFMTVVVKTHNDPHALLPSIRRLVRELDPNLPLYRVRTLDELAARSIAQQRFQTLLVNAFSMLVFVLAVIGTYGVTAYGVSERASELGIRMALGATGGDIRWLVLREGSRLAIAGIAIGGVAAVLMSRTLSRFVFQIGALDSMTFIVTSVLLAAAALLAAFLPAHRAARADPLRVLRAE